MDRPNKNEILHNIPPTPQQAEFIEKFKVGRNDLRRAMNYERNSDRAKMLRTAALQSGGLVYTGYTPKPGYCPPGIETQYDHVRNVMYQKLGERIALEVCLTTNDATLYVDDELVVKFDAVTLETWRGVLFAMQQLYDKLATNN